MGAGAGRASFRLPRILRIDPREGPVACGARSDVQRAPEGGCSVAFFLHVDFLLASPSGVPRRALADVQTETSRPQRGDSFNTFAWPSVFRWICPGSLSAWTSLGWGTWGRALEV